MVRLGRRLDEDLNKRAANLGIAGTFVAETVRSSLNGVNTFVVRIFAWHYEFVVQRVIGLCQ